MERKRKRPKNFKGVEIGGIQGVFVSSWEEEQEARQQGYQNFHWREKPVKKKGAQKKRWLSGRIRYGRYDGIFDVK
jgi:hypothetical protein